MSYTRRRAPTLIALALLLGPAFLPNASATAPPPPTAYAPGSTTESGAPEIASSETFSWSSVAGAAGYILYMSKSPYGSSNIILTRYLSGTNVVISKSEINSAGGSASQFRWGVTAYNSQGQESVQSNVRYFKATQNIAPTCSRSSPSQHVTATIGQSITFQASCNDPEAQWYAATWVADDHSGRNDYSAPASSSWTPSQTYSWSVAGSKSVGMATVDRSGASSNQVWWYVTVVQANLVIDSITFNPEPPVRGQGSTITCNYRNAGTAGTNVGFDVRVSVDSTSQTANVAALGSGASGSRSFSFGSFSAGAHTVLCEVNANRAVSESNYADSSYAISKNWVAPSVTISTTSNPNGGGVPSGTSVYDAATLTGTAGVPTGTVTFFLCQPAQVTAGGCEGSAGAQVGSAVALSGGNAQSARTTATTTLGKYCWRVAYSGDSSYDPKTHTNSGSECFTTVAHPPSAPKNLQATPGPGLGEISLTWDAPDNDGGAAITSYKIYRGATSGGQDYLDSTTERHYEDERPGSGVWYYYVSAVNGRGEGPPSPEASAASVDGSAGRPTAPTGLDPGARDASSPAPVGSFQPTLSWQSSPSAQRYLVSVWTLEGTLVASGLSEGVTEWRIPDPLNPDTTYGWTVKARNPAGTSDASVTMYFRTPSQPAPPVVGIRNRIALADFSTVGNANCGSFESIWVSSPESCFSIQQNAWIDSGGKPAYWVQNALVVAKWPAPPGGVPEYRYWWGYEVFQLQSDPYDLKRVACNGIPAFGNCFHGRGMTPFNPADGVVLETLIQGGSVTFVGPSASATPSLPRPLASDAVLRTQGSTSYWPALQFIGVCCQATAEFSSLQGAVVTSWLKPAGADWSATVRLLRIAPESAPTPSEEHARKVAWTTPAGNQAQAAYSASGADDGIWIVPV